MINPFAKKKSSRTIQGIIVNNNNSISGQISSLPSGLTTISIGNTGYCGPIGVQGVSGSIQGVTGAYGWGYASAATYTYMNPEEVMKRRKEELMKEFEQNPELFSEIIVELRQRKIRQLKDKSQVQ